MTHCDDDSLGGDSRMDSRSPPGRVKGGGERSEKGSRGSGSESCQFHLKHFQLLAFRMFHQLLTVQKSL